MGEAGGHYDHRVTTNAIDDVARERPDAVYASIPSSLSLGDGFRDITYAQYAAAINRAADWLEEELGGDFQNEILPYIAASDLCYPILLLAALKVNCKMLFLSPRNSLEGQLSLIDACNCKVFLTSSTCPPPVQALIDARDLRHCKVPLLEDLLGGPKPKSRPPSLRSFDEIRHEPLAYLHSSGSTGLPKLIGWTFGCVHGHSAQLDFQDGSGDKTLMQRLALGGKNFLSCFPMFHAGGLWFAIAYELGLRIIVPPAGQLVNADMVASILRMGNVDTACVPPAILEDISKKPEWRASLSKLKYILTGGAPLSKAVGDVLQACGPRIWNVHASTETGFLPLMDVAKEDWLYARFAPGFGLELRPYENDVYELVVVRDEKIFHKQMVFQNYPELYEYSTQDLFRRHPDPKKPDHWLSCGRHDDVIVLSNGEKFNPKQMEDTIQSHRLVSKALIFGRDRFQSAVLIELHDSAVTDSVRNRELTIHQLWGIIEQANAQAPSHGKISRSLVNFTHPLKPMPRTPKDSVIRNATYELYAVEMDDLYTSSEGTTMQEMNANVQSADPFQVLSLQHLIRGINPAVASVLGEHDNLFTLGFDSLQVLQLVQEINKRSPSTILEARTVYSHPNLASLSRILKSPHRPTPVLTTREEAIAALVARYSGPYSEPPLIFPKVALLTGATGSLGSHILTKLIKSNHYAHVFCLVRTLPSLSTIPNPRITYLKTSFADPHLGLANNTYSHLLHTVTHVIHNAWTVNFNLPLAAFEEHLLGVRHLISFSLRSKRKAQFLFVSSIGSVLNAREKPVPEREYTDASVAEEMGYGESKHISERLLSIAGRSEGLKYKIVRIGQIAGPVHEHGVWNTVEWIPRMLESSKAMQCVPESLGAADTVNWVPADVVAQILVDVLGADDGKSEAVYHIQNSQSVAWRDLLPAVHQAMGKATEIISFAAWTARLKARASASTLAGERLPALRLLDLYERLSASGTPKLVTLDVGNTTKVSEALRDLGPVTGEMMGAWMKQWGF